MNEFLTAKPLPAGVSSAKIERMTTLIQATLAGNRRARGFLESHLTAGDDSIHNLAYVTGVNILPMFEKAPRTWDQIATTKSVQTFDGYKLYTLDEQVEGFARPVTEPGKPNHVPPIVAEGAPYPHFTFKGELLESGKMHKRGGKFSLTWEQIINDLGNLLPQIPQLITQFFLDAEEWEVYAALIGAATASQQLQAGTNVDGETVVANAPLSRRALVQAVTQLQTRSVDGRLVRISGGFNLVVPIGQKGVADFYINNLTLSEQTSGNNTFAVSGYNPLAGINVVESEYVTGTNWYLLPAKGATVRPVLELLKLQGHESIDIRVENVTGNYVGGGAVAPFEGSFDTDDASFRGRYPIKGSAMTPDLILWSTGAGA